MDHQQGGWSAFAGIDWGGEHHQLCIVDAAGRRMTQLRVAHDVAGLADHATANFPKAETMPVT